MTTALAPTTDTMKAVTKTGPGQAGVHLREVAVPTALTGHAKVRVTATGICGTDIHIAHDEYAHEAPVVMGHEVLGEVVEVGDAGAASWIGKRVACETYFSTCRTCDWCRTGRPNLCRSRRSIGSFENGGFAEYLVVPVTNLHELPTWLGEFDGALAEPLACVAQCLMDPPIIEPGDRVLVTGPGAMGQLAAQVALAHSAHVVLAGLPRDTDRLEVAAGLGITTTTDAVEPEAFDVVLECSGSAAAARNALAAARRGGHYVQIGIFGRPVELDIDQVLYKEITVSSGFASTPASWRAAMRLIEQRAVTLAPLITHKVSLADFDDAFEAAQAGTGLKTIVVP